MRHRRWVALLLAAVVAVCLLSGCGLGAQSGLVHLNENSIQKMLKKDGLNITVTQQDALNRAVERAAQSLEGAQRPDPEPAAVRSQIAREIGTPPLICGVYDSAYWPNRPWGNPNRYEQTAASFAQRLYKGGHGNAYAASVATFTTRDGEKMLLFVMTKGC